MHRFFNYGAGVASVDYWVVSAGRCKQLQVVRVSLAGGENIRGAQAWTSSKEPPQGPQEAKLRGHGRRCAGQQTMGFLKHRGFLSQCISLVVSRVTTVAFHPADGDLMKDQQCLDLQP